MRKSSVTWTFRKIIKTFIISNHQVECKTKSCEEVLAPIINNVINFLMTEIKPRKKLKATINYRWENFENPPRNDASTFRLEAIIVAKDHVTTFWTTMINSGERIFYNFLIAIWTLRNYSENFSGKFIGIANSRFSLVFTYSLVLICCDGSKRRFGENESTEIEIFSLLLDSVLWEVNDVKTGLISVHRVENYLEWSFISFHV